MDGRLSLLVRASRMDSLLSSFLKTARIAYVDIRLYSDLSRSTSQAADLADDAGYEALEYTDKSIRILRGIKEEAGSVSAKSRRAAISVAGEQDKISSALKEYVRIEKNWSDIKNISDEVMKNGFGGREREILADIESLLSGMRSAADKAIFFLSSVRTNLTRELA